MVKKVTLGTKICQALIWLVVILMTLSCLLPLINMVAISLSSSNAVASNTVGLLPVELTFSTTRSCSTTRSSGLPSGFPCSAL